MDLDLSSVKLQTAQGSHDRHNAAASTLTASQRTGATAAGEYSWRAPSPPHIIIPPTSEDKQLVLPAYSGLGSVHEEEQILKSIVQGHHVSGGVRGWKYEMRRQAQLILPYLYLGPSAAARDIDALKREGITMLLVIRSTMTAAARLLSGEKVASQLGIVATAIDVAWNPELIAAFPRITKVINDHLISVYRQRSTPGLSAPNISSSTSPGKVLVFCESGNERSATVVAAYLMAMHDLDVVGAIQFIQSQRFCVAFDDSLKNLLYSYQQLLEAQRSVSVARRQQRAPSVGAKRARDDSMEEEDDMDLDYVGDVERFRGRCGFAAFYDDGAQ